MRGFGSYGYGMMGHHWLGAAFGLVFWLLLITGVVLFVIWAIRRGSQGPANVPLAGPSQPGIPMRADGHDEAVAIAKRRLASGEVPSEQYAEIIRTLGV